MRLIHCSIPDAIQTLSPETLASDVAGRFLGQTYQLRHSIKDFKSALGLRRYPS